MKIMFMVALWLPLFAGAQPAPPNNFLETLNGSAQPSIGWYSGTTLKSEKSFANGLLKTNNSEWACTVTSAKAPEADGLDMDFSFKLKSGSDNQTAPSVSFKFGQWSTDNYVLIPASVYNGNRYRILGNSYNPRYTRDMFYNPDVPLTISNNPHLTADGNSSLEVQTTNASTPAVCFFSPGLKRGFILLTDQDTWLGNSGISISESAAAKEGVIKITAPAMRKQAAGFGRYFPSGDVAPSWTAGGEVTIRFRLFSFEAAGIPDLLKRFFQVRKSLSGENNPRNLLPMSQLRKYGTDLCRGRWIVVQAGQYYQAENSRDLQLGWLGGLVNTYPMLAINDATERSRVQTEMDFIVDKMQGTSGYFYGQIDQYGRLISEKGIPEIPQMHAMVRKNGDNLLWFIKHFILFKKQGYESLIAEKWEAAAHKLAEAFVKTWRKDGQFGQYIDPDTGLIAVYNSAAGAIVPAALALASRYFNEDSFLQTAIEAARYYYEQFVVKQGLTGGGCGDISQDSDSESAHGFLESLMTLYALTGDKSWLDKAEVQAALCSTWVSSYDHAFPPESDAAKLQCKMAGAVWASIQNKHAAPGICTSSGDYIFKLYRATGNRLYADLIRDIQRAHTEATHFPGHPTAEEGNGSAMERIQPSDAEGRGKIGELPKGINFWTVNDGTLMTLELPGIYWQTDKNEFYVFDQVEAERFKENGINKIKITNPTPFDAAVSIFMETSAQAKKTLLAGEFYEWPTVTVKAGKSVIYPAECIPPLPCFSPKEANVWIAGDNYRFDFNNGKFQTSDRKDYGTNVISTSVSICDKESGDLRFYSDGKNVWNKNFNIMPNGDGLISGDGFGQHALIVPMPGNKEKYFLFTVKCQANAHDNGLYCHVVDMSLDGGMGDVAPGAKNTLLLADAAEALTATLHANGNDFWLVAHENGTNRFVVFPIAYQGVGTPAFFAIGATYERFPKGAAKGSIIISPDRAKLAFNLNTHQDIVRKEDENSPLEIYDFGPKTGVISNRLALAQLSNIQTLIFSPDNTKLYAGCYDNTPSQDYGLLQFDLSAGTPEKIVNSRSYLKWPYKPIADIEPMPSFKLQLGPDGRLYSGAMGGKQNGINQRVLFYLEQPNLPLKDAKPGFRYLDSPNNKNISPDGYKPEQSFPNFMQYYFCGLESAELKPATAVAVAAGIKEEDMKLKETVTVFPNPAEELLSIGGSSEKYLFPACIKIYSAEGKLLQEQEVQSPPFPKIDIRAFKAGVYILNIQNQNGVSSVKVIKRGDQ
ncbi:MAG: hypothetical protein CRN43_06530 [Candidatus Nephrothrix sp. EaCA]|nr:MAG: hypothetical protein CRN43_06530 [Candidatus Nephrothrix sp. EaCA]